MALFSPISWCLWLRQNRLRENQPTWPLKEVGERAIIIVQEFLDTCKTDAAPSGPVGIYKVNFDSAMFENIG